MAHRMHASIPEIEITHYADAPRIGRPHAEMHATHAGNFAHVRSQFFVLLVVRTFTGKIQVVLGEHRRESIRIVSLENVSVTEAKLHAISIWSDGFALRFPSAARGNARFKHSVGMNSLGAVRFCFLVKQDCHFRRTRAEHSYQERFLPALLDPV